MLHQRRLATAVLAHERDPLAGRDGQVDPVERPDLALGVDMDQALDGDAGHATRSAGSSTVRPAASSARRSRTARRDRHAQVLQPRVGQDVAGGPVEHDAPSVEDQHPGADAGEQVGLLLRDEDRDTVPGQRRERLTDERRPGRIELRGRLVEDQVARAHGQQARDGDQLHLAARQAMPESRARGASMPMASSAA